ncbi:sensor histidine kinase [Streptomyces coeruleoprunus]|uniref:histidine kinase n=1 Tax=Streptomyces coeruleoprunus TaxID=285563 RepID=A0ABV9XMM0_9ACTN
MHRLIRPLTRQVTYLRWLHLCVPSLVVAVWMFIDRDRPWMVALLMAPFGLVPWVRRAEGVQARLLLVPAGAGVAMTPSADWAQRWRTVLWLEVRLLVAGVAMAATVLLPTTSVEMVMVAAGHGPGSDGLVPLEGLSPRWLGLPLALVPLAVLFVVVVLLGRLITVLALRLLGPSATERLTALEERTERLLHGNRLARELHDSIGHALTVAVVQAGAARTANDPLFTERALEAIEETGRNALEDLERVLKVLREPDHDSGDEFGYAFGPGVDGAASRGSGPAGGRRPGLDQAARLLDAARSSGADLTVEVTGPVTELPGPLSREGYRILQESLTNVLRHAGGVPVRVRIAVSDAWLDIEVANPATAAATPAGRGGSGLRGIQERAALLGGKAFTGLFDGEWRVSASLPLAGLR